MNIYLMGLPGVGKSSVGIKLAKALDYSFVDLDVLIEMMAAKFVDEIIEMDGLEFFRDLETNALSSLSSNKKTVIALGGGTPLRTANQEMMNGLKIYLKAPLDIIQTRIDSSSIIRPLLKDNSLGDLLKERGEVYLKLADLVVENDTTIDQTVTKILEGLKK